jgi:type I restriction enzyme S subunit
MTAIDWETWKLSHAFGRIGSGTTPTSSDTRYYTDSADSDGMPWVTTAELRENYISSTQQKVTQDALGDFSALRIYRPGSVMMAMYGATIGRLGITEVAATCNQACCVFETSEQFHNRFLFYWLWHRRGDLIAMSVGGGQSNLSQQDLRGEKALCPPLATQQRIARFLDEKTARIDGLIGKKRALLDRLAEKRQALITRAVTKGLNPDAPMKPSGIDWLGDIPAHWNVKRFRFTARLISGSTPTTTVPEYWDGEIPWISPKDVKADELLSSADRVTEYAVSDYGLKLHADDNAVIVIRGMILARKVPVAVARGKYTINQDMKVIRSKGEVIPEFFQMYLSSIESFLFTLVAEAGHGTKALRTDLLSDVPILLPPIEEQRFLSATLARNREKTDEAIQKIRDSLARLIEYRAALITAAVTGQIAELC